MVIKAQNAMKSKLYAFFIFSIDGGYVYSFRLPPQKNVHINHRKYFGWGMEGGWGEGQHLSPSATYLIATSEASTAVAMATATQQKHQSSSTAMLPKHPYQSST
jgi:hypothetical protein